MATQAELEAEKNTLLAPGQPITATIHKSWAQKIIDELYNVVSRGKVLAGTTTVGSIDTGDKVVIIRGSDTKLIDKNLLGGTLIPLIPAGVSESPINMDAQHQNIVIFYGPTGFDAPRSLSLVNIENLKIFDFVFSIGNVAAVVTLPDTFRTDDVHVTSNIWTAEQTGIYKMHAVLNGSVWVVDFYGPYL